MYVPILSAYVELKRKLPLQETTKKLFGPVRTDLPLIGMINVIEYKLASVKKYFTLLKMFELLR